MEKPDRQYFGATPKYILEIDAGPLAMSDYDFFIRLQRGPNSYEVRKDEMIVADGDYYFIVDTARLGVGLVCLIAVTSIPDTDVDGGFRTEVDVIETFLEILPL
jgi:hypothetical protein